MILAKLLLLVTLQMPSLPYAKDALEPVISEQTIEFHYGKHLQGYVNTLTNMIKGTEYENRNIEELVKTVPTGAMYNNAGQALNHILYFTQFMAPVKDNAPKGKIAEKINAEFGSFGKFKEEFSKACTTLFGSGWAWLSQDANGKLVITQEPNGNNPLRSGLNPLMGIDVWEHAYYLDYQNRRADHVKAVWDIINWEVVESRLK
jgi:Fe-Mn family superoxide dismutase